MGGAILKPIEKELKYVTDEILEPIEKEFKKLEEIPEFFEDVEKEINNIPKHFNKFPDKVLGPMEDGFNFVGEEFDKLPERIDGVVDQVVDPVTGAFEDAGDFFVDLGDDIFGTLEDLWEDIEEGFQEVEKFFVDMGEQIREFFEMLGDYIVDAANMVGGAVEDGFWSVIEIIENAFKELVRIEEIFNQIMDYIRCSIKLLINFPKCLFVYFLDALGQVFLLCIWLLFLIVGWDEWWSDYKEENIDPHFGWPNTIQNDCFRCKNKEDDETTNPPPSAGILNMISNGLKSLKRNSFIIFMCIAMISLSIMYAFHYYFFQKATPETMNFSSVE